jgi:hypothetical protein
MVTRPGTIGLMIKWKQVSGPVLALTYLGWFGIAAVFLVLLAFVAPLFEAACKDLGLSLPGDIVLLFAAARTMRGPAGLPAWACISLAPLAFLAIPMKREGKILAVTAITTALFFVLLAATGALFHAWWLIAAARAG